MGKHTQTKENNVKKKKKKKGSFGRKIFLIILIVCAIAGIKFAKKINELEGNWLAALFGHNEETLKNLEPLQVLVMGESTGMSDTIIVCSYNPKTQKASMLSIPRDTYVTNGKYKYSSQNKINSVYNSGKNPERTLEAVNELTGLDIKYYILVDTEALIKLVDLIGGVEFDVPIDMDYDDYSQDLHIHLEKGYQTLTGKQAEQVVRFRHNNDGSSYSYEYGNEDYGRMRTQRNLIIAVAKQTIKLKNIKEIGNMMNIMKEDVKTNVDFEMLVDYIPYAVNINLDTIQTAQLPGESKQKYGGWFYFHDEEETLTLVDELFNEKLANTEGNTIEGNNIVE